MQNPNEPLKAKVQIKVRNPSIITRFGWDHPQAVEIETITRVTEHSSNLPELVRVHTASGRIVRLENIVEILPPVVPPPVIVPLPSNGFDEQYKVKSPSGNEYLITRRAKVGMKCTCPAYTFHKDCKHLSFAFDFINDSAQQTSAVN